jgi:hypothetical protein
MEKTQDTNKIQQVTNTTNIKYEGKVVVSIVKGKKVISSTTYKNKGKLPLFRFIVDCLRGDYSSAEAYRPKYIQLLSAGKSGDDVPAESTSMFSTTITPKIIYQQTPATFYYKKKNNTTEDYATITFKFMIPFSQLNSQANINLFCLYDQESYSISSCGNTKV